MQSSVENALELVAVGNAYLKGRDISGFWPDAPTFRWMKTCEFRAAPKNAGKDTDDYPLIATDPMLWFASLRPWCKGLRLHLTERKRGPNQQIDVPDRMLAAFVGGGARWLIEAVGEERSEIWESFQRLGDRNDLDRRIWLTTYIRQGEVDPADANPVTLAAALAAFKRVLPEIEAYAREEKYDNFAECFARARMSLESHKREPNEFMDAFQRFSGASDEQLGILEAVMSASVFGGMGSWNDIGGGERYDELSQRLYSSLNEVTAGLANSTYRC
jgi:hypothetical protein